MSSLAVLSFVTQVNKGTRGGDTSVSSGSQPSFSFGNIGVSSFNESTLTDERALGVGTFHSQLALRQPLTSASVKTSKMKLWGIDSSTLPVTTATGTVTTEPQLFEYSPVHSSPLLSQSSSPLLFGTGAPDVSSPSSSFESPASSSSSYSSSRFTRSRRGLRERAGLHRGRRAGGYALAGESVSHHM